jgi:DNA polymerase-3 subunit delta
MSIKHFIQEIEKGLKSPVYFLYAEDPYLLKEASMMAARTVPEGERDFSLTIFDLDGVDETPPFKQILDVVNTIPFMGKQQVVIIENMQELARKDLEPLEHYVSDPSPYSVLMLFCKGSPKAHFRELTKKVKTITLDIRAQELSFWIKEKARQKGLEVTDGAIEYLLGAVGPDVGLISSELEKFTLIGKGRIDAGDIMGIVRGSSDYDAFDLVNALKERDADRVFRVARNLQETQESYGLLGAINWHYSRMSSRDRGRADYYERVFELLNEADIRIKSSGGTFPLEYLLVRLLQI